MRSETVPNGTDGANEPSINSSRRLNIIAADQAGAMDLIIDAELEKNSEFVHDNRPSSCPPENSSGIRAPSIIMHKENGHSCFFDQETNNLRSGHTKSPRLHVRMRYSQHRFLGGEYSHKGWVTLLRWSQDIGVQTAQFNIKQVSTTRSDKLVNLELHYKTKSSMCNALSFQDLADQIPILNPRRKKIGKKRRAPSTNATAADDNNDRAQQCQEISPSSPTALANSEFSNDATKRRHHIQWLAGQGILKKR